MKRTLLALLALSGCGLPDETEDGVRHDDVTVARQAPLHAARRDLETVHQRSLAAPELAVSLSGLPQEGRVFAVVGMLSCGFLEVGRADGAISAGETTLNIPLEPQTQGHWS